MNLRPLEVTSMGMERGLKTMHINATGEYEAYIILFTKS